MLEIPACPIAIRPQCSCSSVHHLRMSKTQRPRTMCTAHDAELPAVLVSHRSQLGTFHNLAETCRSCEKLDLCSWLPRASQSLSKNLSNFPLDWLLYLLYAVQSSLAKASVGTVPAQNHMPGTTLFCSPLKGIPKPAMIALTRQNRFARLCWSKSRLLYIETLIKMTMTKFHWIPNCFLHSIAFPRSRQWRMFSSAHGCKGMFFFVAFRYIEVCWGVWP